MKSKRLDFRRRKAGFTLIEMILVIALIALLAGVAVGRVDKIFGNSEIKLTKLRVSSSFKTPLMTYRIDMGGFPTTEEGLKALLEKPATDRGNWKGPYIDGPEALLDGWQSPLQYRYPGTHNADSYDLYSYGPDKKESGDDITNW